MRGISMGADRILSKYDCQRLQKIVAEGGCDTTIIASINNCITNAKQVEPKKIKPNIVTMNSQFVLTDLGNGKKDVFSLVFPDESDIKHNKISVLSGIGAQLLGRAIGTVIRGIRGADQYLLIENILYQPEAAGDYHL